MYVTVAWQNKTHEEKEVSCDDYDAYIIAKIQCRKEKSKDVAKEKE